MRLQKIQRFLKENNIEFTYSSNKYSNNEFGTINIKDDKTELSSVSEITGRRGNTPSGILAFFSNKLTGRNEKVEFFSQQEIIDRIKNELKR